MRASSAVSDARAQGQCAHFDCAAAAIMKDSTVSFVPSLPSCLVRYRVVSKSCQEHCGSESKAVQNALHAMPLPS